MLGQFSLSTKNATWITQVWQNLALKGPMGPLEGHSRVQGEGYGELVQTPHFDGVSAPSARS
jgi:hypothetical protein